jgi:hypothetical protein
MVSTLLTSTIGTGAGFVPNAARADVLALILTLMFFALAVQKEIASGTSSIRLREGARGLNIALLPLGFGFVIVVWQHLPWAVR